MKSHDSRPWQDRDTGGRGDERGGFDTQQGIREGGR